METKLINLPKKFRWNDVKKHKFVKTINSIEFRSKLIALPCNTGHLSCNTAVEELTRVVQKVADRTKLIEKVLITHKKLNGPVTQNLLRQSMYIQE